MIAIYIEKAWKRCRGAAVSEATRQVARDYAGSQLVWVHSDPNDWVIFKVRP
jgi:hypothetical protein